MRGDKRTSRTGDGDRLINTNAPEGVRTLARGRPRLGTKRLRMSQEPGRRIHSMHTVVEDRLRLGSTWSNNSNTDEEVVERGRVREVGSVRVDGAVVLEGDARCGCRVNEFRVDIRGGRLDILEDVSLAIQDIRDESRHLKLHSGVEAEGCWLLGVDVDRCAYITRASTDPAIVLNTQAPATVERVCTLHILLLSHCSIPYRT